MGGPAVGGDRAAGQILAGACPITFRPSDLHSLEGGGRLCATGTRFTNRPGRWFTRLTQLDSRLCHLAPSPLAGEGWGEGEMVLVPSVPETPKKPPSPSPSPALGRGDQLRRWGKIVGGSRRWKVKEEPWVPVRLSDVMFPASTPFFSLARYALNGEAYQNQDRCSQKGAGRCPTAPRAPLQAVPS